MRKSVFTSFVAASVLAGCSPFVPWVNLKELPADQQQAVRRVRIWGNPQLVNRQYEVLSIVEGHSCQVLQIDGPATRLDAIEQLKAHAWQAGADGLADIRCGAKEGLSPAANCWELISCTAEAIKVSGTQ